MQANSHKMRLMPARPIRIATRRSRLALWQAQRVASAIGAANPGVATELLGMSTQGDRQKGSPLHTLGGKGVFVKELETALLEGRADIAVHSMKDMPAALPPGLAIGGMLERADPRDALVSSRYASLAALPAGAVLGSSSLRRRCQLQLARPGLDFQDLRGNVETRLARLDAGDYDGLLLAVAGLERLGLGERIAERLPVDACIPAAGQGAIGMEVREGDADTGALVASVAHEPTQRCVLAERAVTAALGADCSLPIGAFAEIEAGEMRVRAFVSKADASAALIEAVRGSADAGERLGAELGRKLLDLGADRLLAG